MSASVQTDSEAGGGDLSIARLVEDNGIEVILSDGTSLHVADSAPELQGLELHRPLSAEQLAGLHFAAQRREIARRVFGWLERRAYATGRLREKLRELDFPDSAVDAVLAQFQKKGLVDDEAFTRLYVADQLRKRPVGLLWLLAKLREQGVGRDVAERIVSEELPHERELAVARRALDKRPPSEDPAKSLRFLAGRGFRASVARRAASERFDRDVEFGD